MAMPWEKYGNPFETALQDEGVSGPVADFARSIYSQESGSGRNTKTSNQGAVGGMQIIPSTFATVADKGWNISDPIQNARAGIRYAKQMFERAKGDPKIAAAGYYGGSGGLDKASRGIAVFDPKNPNAPNTLQYGEQVASRIPASSVTGDGPWNKYKPSATAEAPTVAPKPEIKPPDSATQFIFGNINKGLAGILGSPVDIARQGINQLGLAASQGPRGPLAPQPSFQPLPENIPGGSKSIENLGKMAGVITPQAEPTSGLGRLGAEAIQLGTQLAVPGAEGIMRIPGATRAGIRKGGELLSDLRGTKVPGAISEATTAAREASQTGASGLEKLGTRREQQAATLDTVRSNLEAKLEASRTRPVDLNTQGETIRSSFTGAMDAAKEARKAEADRAFPLVKDIAAAKEVTGARVNTANAQRSLNDLIERSKGIPDLQSKLKSMLSSIKGAPTEIQAPLGTIGKAPTVGKAGFKAARPTTPEPAGKTFEELELTRRYLNDIAYGADSEGYSAIMRNEAKTAAREIDKSMGEFVPEFKAYKDKYRAMSEPMDSLGTRFGRAVSSTEGGLKGDVYAKVADSDLPNRLFARKDGVEVLVDALSGGKKATPEARASAQRQVNTMVENWIVESVRGGKKTGQGALQQLAAPQMRSTLSAVPSVEKRLATQFGREAKTEAVIGKVTKKGEELGKQGATAKDAATTIRNEISMADEKAALPGVKSKREAYNSYVSAMAKARRANIIPSEQYKAALALVDRATTLEDKTATIQRLMKRIAIGGAAVGTGYEIKGVLQ